MSYISYLPTGLNPTDRHQLIIGSVAPRPIALVSTIDEEGNTNLAPFSFYTAISSSPPILIFSVSKPAGAKNQKDTIENLKLIKDCVINVVDKDIARQMSLCSVDFDRGISEFKKAGFGIIKSDLIQSPRVKESPVQFECTVRDILVFGNTPGAANLVICDVLKIHIKKNKMMDNKIRIDDRKLNTVGRLGRSNYVDVNDSNVFEMYQNTKTPIIGFDLLPSSVLKSTTLLAKDLADLASNTALPNKQDFNKYTEANPELISLSKNEWHIRTKKLLTEGKKEEALLCALMPDFLNGKIEKSY